MDSGNRDWACGHEPEQMEIDDSTLWSRSRAGDVDAFGLLFERYAKTLYNYCFRRVGDWAASEDLVSIVFLEAWRRRDKELPADKVLPWLYGVATNVIRNRRRSERRFASALSRVPEPLPEPGFDHDADARLDDEREMRRVLAIVAQLRQPEQEVFALCAWCDLSYEDAAVALSIPVGTVRSRLSRARRHLRELNPGLGHEPARTPIASKETLEP